MSRYLLFLISGARHINSCSWLNISWWCIWFCKLQVKLNLWRKKTCNWAVRTKTVPTENRWLNFFPDKSRPQKYRFKLQFITQTHFIEILKILFLLAKKVPVIQAKWTVQNDSLNDYSKTSVIVLKRNQVFQWGIYLMNAFWEFILFKNFPSLCYIHLQILNEDFEFLNDQK